VPIVNFVVDVRDGRVACVVGRAGAQLRLRGVAGSGEWLAPPEVVRVASAWEVRNADLWEETRRFWPGSPWRSQPDRRPEAQPLTHRMRCDLCGRRSERSVEFGQVQSWQIQHVATHPGHRLYTETLTRPWLAHLLGEIDHAH
jgi:hypothetical protein